MTASIRRAVDAARTLVTAIAEDETRSAALTLKRIKRQQLSPRVLIVLAIIAAGALKDAHGEAWKDHVTDYPGDLHEEDA